MTIVGYAFDGSTYCVGCLENPEECDCIELDDNGMCEANCHGYGPNPIFDTDEDASLDSCDACGEMIGG